MQSFNPYKNYPICISKYLACLSSNFSESLLSDEILKQGVILFQKCFFTHLRNPLYQVRDSYSI